MRDERRDSDAALARRAAEFRALAEAHAQRRCACVTSGGATICAAAADCDAPTARQRQRRSGIDERAHFRCEVQD